MEPWLEKFARASFRRSADTAHDLKTPLNVAVLNLELLRMRVRKIADEEDEKLGEYTHAIETELRRMGAIFDAFFLLSTPPRGDELSAIDVAVIMEKEAAAHGFDLERARPSTIEAHESRIRQAGKLFFDGVVKLLRDGERNAVISGDANCYAVTITGKLRGQDVELSKAFKFYYTDAEGNPDLALASARLIAETYGGDLSAIEDHDTVALRLSFPLERDEESLDR